MNESIATMAYSKLATTDLDEEEPDCVDLLKVYASMANGATVKSGRAKACYSERYLLSSLVVWQVERWESLYKRQSFGRAVRGYGKVYKRNKPKNYKSATRKDRSELWSKPIDHTKQVCVGVLRSKTTFLSEK